MRRIIAPALALVGAAGSLLCATVLPWAYYGTVEIPVHRFPGWPVYAVSALALHIFVAWTLLAPDGPGRTRRTLGAAAVAVSVGSTVVLGLRYDEAGDLFTGVVPMVLPHPGPGPAVALLAVMASVGAVLVAARPDDQPDPSSADRSPRNRPRAVSDSG